jgi:hypothetical protein
MRSLGCARSARNAALFIAVGLSAVAAPKAAAEEPTRWVVAASQGDATQQAADGAALPVAAGAVLAEGASVRTGADGRLVVAHGNDRMTVSANSAFTMPRDADPATGPSILQTLGTLLFKVEHTPGRRFEVDTPYLAAVVKGTVFTVSIEGGAQIVHVAQGAVEVSAALSHDAVLVRPGQTATLSSPSGTPAIIDGHRSSVEPDGKSTLGDAAPGPMPAAPGAKPTDAAGDRDSAAPGKAADAGAERLTRTLGQRPLDLSALTNGLVKSGKDLPPLGASASSDPATEAALMQNAPVVGDVMSASGASPNVPVAGAQPGLAVAPVTLPATLPVLHSASPTASLPGSNSPISTGRKH